MTRRKIKKKHLKQLYYDKISREFKAAMQNQDAEKAAEIMVKGAETSLKIIDKSLWLYPYISKSRPDPLTNINELSYQLSNFTMHDFDRLLLKEAYQDQETIHWQATLADVSIKDHNVYLLLNHIIPVIKGTTVEFNPQKASFYEYHLWLNVKNIFSLPQNKQKLAIGDTIIGTSLIKQYKNKTGRVKYGLGATKLEFCGIFKVTRSEFLSAAGRQLSFDAEYNNYLRKYPVLLLAECLNYDIRSQRYRNLTSFANSHDHLINAVYFKQNRKRYFEMINDPKVRQKRLTQMKKRATESFEKQFEVNNIDPDSPLMQKRAEHLMQMHMHNKNVD